MIGYHLEREIGGEIERPSSKGWKNFGRSWTRGLMGLENWTIFMDVIFVSFLSNLLKGKHSQKSPTGVINKFRNN